LQPQTREFLAHEFQIDPGFAFLAGAAQQVSGVIGHDQWQGARPEAMHLAAKAADRRIGLQQILRSDPTDRQDQPWAQQFQLPLQEGAAVGRLLGPGIAVPRRAALEHVGDIHGLSRMPHGAQH